MRLRDGSAQDVAFVMAVERLPGYEAVIGQWSAEEHAAEMANAASHYLIAEEGGETVGFAIVQDLDDPFGNFYLKRIAVARQGAGTGARFLRLVLEWAFSRPGAHRFHLHFSERNERGRRLYASAGFRDEGIERERYALSDGTRVSSVRVSILRSEWEALRAP